MSATKKIKVNEIPPSSEERPQTFCFLQITRTGDVIQTLQAVNELKSKHPDIRLILVARKQYASQLDFLLSKTFDKCFYFNLNSFVKTANGLNSVQKNLSEFIKDINEENIDITINFSYSKSSAYLGSLINSKYKLGPYFNSQAKMVISDKWSQYVYSNVLGGPLSSFSLIDAFKRVIGLDFDRLPPPRKKPANNIRNIVIHPFASIARKRWKPGKWVEIIYKIAKEIPDVNLFIVGAKEDSEEAGTMLNGPLLIKHKAIINNLVGKTTIEELHNLMESASLFIGHDSLVGNIASLQNVQTLTISLGCVRPVETTPYGERNYNLVPRTKCFPCFPNDKCDLFQCHSDIPYQVVFSCTQQLISHGKITKEGLQRNNTCFHLGSVNCYESSFSNLGLLKLTDILQHGDSIDNVFRNLYRILWPFLIDEKEEKNNFPILTDVTRNNLDHYQKGLEYIYQLSEFGKKYSKAIIEEVAKKTPNVAIIKNDSAKIDDVDRTLETVKNVYPHLAPLVDYFSIAKGNLSGENVVELSESSFIVFHALSISTSAIFELIGKSINADRNKRGKERSL